MMRHERSQTEFRYRALRGTSEEHGVLSAETEREAINTLVAQHLTPLSVTPVKSVTGPGRPLLSGTNARNYKAQDVEQLLSEISTLLAAGVSMDEVLDSLATAHARMPLGPAMVALRDSIRGGGSFFDGLKVSALPVAPFAFALVSAGEASGQLADALAEIALQMSYEREVRAEMKNALIYPSILVGTGIVVIGIVFMAVVPRFAPLLKGGKADIPALSRWVIESGVYVNAHLPQFGFGALALLAVLVACIRAPEIRRQLLGLGFSMPVMGPWLKETDLGRWATLMGTLLNSRVPILKALELSAESFRLPADRLRIGECTVQLKKGIALSSAIEQARWLGPTQVNLLRVGERSGELPKMFQTLGKMQTASARMRLKRLLIVIEPAAILLIGGVVGFLMVAVMMALTSLNTSVA